jgi:histidyl-tRNA synthetase
VAKSNRNTGPEARLPKGFLDTPAEDIRATHRMLETIRQVFERYGFEPLETPAIEYTDALGKFLPDQDRPNEGVFSFQDEDEQWLSLRYDLTAPLARYVAENFERLPKPFRRYQVGPVWRNEKPGPGRFRQFTQFDADTVGTDNIAADAEICMLAADTMEALGIKRGDYVIKVNNRKVLDGVMEAIGVADGRQKLTILRAIDKYDRLGAEGVRLLLGKGRKDESGDFTKGAELNATQTDRLLLLLESASLRPMVEPGSRYSDRTLTNVDNAPTGEKVAESRFLTVHELIHHFGDSQAARNGFLELEQIAELVDAAGYGVDRIRIDPSVVRGLEYYTGPVFEAEITVPVKNEDGQTVRFGSVGGGGRYDGLVERFMGTKVPATGFSIGVSRLQAALAALGKTGAATAGGPVVVLVMEKDRLADYQRMVQRLRNPDDGGLPIRAEMYLGKAKRLGEQFKYADMRRAPCVVFQGENERNQDPPVVQIKDLIEGAKAAATIKDSKEWREGRPAQISVKEDELVAKVREVLARHKP